MQQMQTDMHVITHTYTHAHTHTLPCRHAGSKVLMDKASSLITERLGLCAAGDYTV